MKIPLSIKKLFGYNEKLQVRVIFYYGYNYCIQYKKIGYLQKFITLHHYLGLCKDMNPLLERKEQALETAKKLISMKKILDYQKGELESFKRNDGRRTNDNINMINKYFEESLDKSFLNH